MEIKDVCMCSSCRLGLYHASRITEPRTQQDGWSHPSCLQPTQWSGDSLLVTLFSFSLPINVPCSWSTTLNQTTIEKMETSFPMKIHILNPVITWNRKCKKLLAVPPSVSECTQSPIFKLKPCLWWKEMIRSRKAPQGVTMFHVRRDFIYFCNLMEGKENSRYQEHHPSEYLVIKVSSTNNVIKRKHF